MAILLVVLGHAGVSFMAGGFIGVDVFFVLSGFLITGLLLSGALARGSVSLADFYARRGRRILPAAALTLVATDIAAYQLLNFVRAKVVVEDSIWASLFGANIRFANLGTDYRLFENPIRRGEPILARPRALLRERLTPYGSRPAARSARPPRCAACSSGPSRPSPSSSSSPSPSTPSRTGSPASAPPPRPRRPASPPPPEPRPGPPWPRRRPSSTSGPARCSRP